MEKVQVLMSTYNGEKYLKEQIESILNQQDVNLSILIRDDGSNDKTIDIIKEYAENDNRINYYIGNNLGPARSFMELVNRSGSEFDYYAFADQDDIWMQNKLKVAIDKLKGLNGPAMYVSSQEIVDEEGKTIGIKKVTGNFTLEGEMIRNFATGCTMVFNKDLRNTINEYNPEYIIMHDSWITRVCYAIGGNVIIDENAFIKYRQHSTNTLGYKDDGIKKLKKQFKIAFKDNISMREKIAKELKNGYNSKLTNDARKLVDNLINYKTDKNSKKWLLNNKKFTSNNRKLDFKVKLAIRLNKF